MPHEATLWHLSSLCKDLAGYRLMPLKRQTLYCSNLTELWFQSVCLRLEIFQYKCNLSATQGLGCWPKWQQDQALGINKLSSEQREKNWEQTSSIKLTSLLKFENETNWRNQQKFPSLSTPFLRNVFPSELHFIITCRPIQLLLDILCVLHYIPQHPRHSHFPCR